MINNFLLKEFGDRIRHLRTLENLSQEQLSYKTGFHRTYIGMIERGERNISLTNMAIFAKAFDLTIDELLKFNNSKELLKQYRLKTED
ncbi:DNA-binding transcriptional regulator, XRE-family HTH domain [Arenibacter palladensis]|uniref:DNA-binding transcriptional regulator, XRE-family HTH domain n=1 Tax=Arenibacter palladensis TaxID=237373 RepID=A0A1M5DTB8_9FLAO|nr:helix-turn-helix transcriptional regulator [Arenibacter palladensis]SHF70166.1 DNA-binding transcriptional regulator, XRE-family HTH domain [Arenibacter palladensis]|tara:strand:- start:421 stop:684 length:264 start_codon:yes stop_codon:yes gene_type:complete